MLSESAVPADSPIPCQNLKRHAPRTLQCRFLAVNLFHTVNHPVDCVESRAAQQDQTTTRLTITSPLLRAILGGLGKDTTVFFCWFSAALQIEVRRGALTVSLQRPSSAMPECALWLREVLK
jgi:hypothetical protein